MVATQQADRGFFRNPKNVKIPVPGYVNACDSVHCLVLNQTQAA